MYNSPDSKGLPVRFTSISERGGIENEKGWGSKGIPEVLLLIYWFTELFLTSKEEQESNLP